MDLFETKSIKPMLIKDIQEPFNSPDYIYELKLDGIRCIAYLNETATDLRNKENDLLLPYYPELADIHVFTKGKCILDGELVIIKNGVPDFFEMQRRMHLDDKIKIELAARQYPASYVAYDILYLNNKELIDLPLLRRKEILEEVINENAKLAVTRYVWEYGIELHDFTKQQNLEGVVGKGKDSKYYFDAETKNWITFKNWGNRNFVVCGYIRKEKGITSLILGQYRGTELLYKGHVTLGVPLNFASEYNLKKIDSSPFRLTPSCGKEAIWLNPELVCEIHYMPNKKGRPCKPVLRGIREGKNPFECQEEPKK
ncbi:DNA ligase [Anaerocolumna aminovalerica]|jgi:bifunctional non-homologous end joining protein LigD|uniref:ATP-dependent DNA ligase n=1 Tax=Anaerocolumna aminovalerica TaxID=1527 RepID=UPI00248CD8C8|nr:DNA ligase [Anaerocolumna aminovalerica]